jgi:hypothetical protein
MSRRAVLAVLACVTVLASTAAAEEPPPFLADRGEGISTSLFGTYIRKGELLVYPFYEYVTNDGAEYKPSELGYPGDLDYEGKEVEHEYLLFLAYGFTDWLAVELEGALYTTATLDTAPEDPSGIPPRLEESGLGDVEAQVRWRWSKETATRPEYFSFFEVVFPLQDEYSLIGTTDWEFAQGFGAIKGFSWGTLSGRIAVKYETVEGTVEPGEYAIEYLRRVSPSWRLVASIEGEDDELSAIGEAQWFIGRHAFLKLNCGFGLTPKAPDIAPEIGVMFSF